MADRQRCHCGGIPVTADGYCADHRDMSNVRTEWTPEHQLAAARSDRSWLQQRVRDLESELKEVRARAQRLQALVGRVQLGDIKPEEINKWL
jgi:hypothetical protein